MLISVTIAAAYPQRALPRAGPGDTGEDFISPPRVFQFSPAGVPGAFKAANGTILAGPRLGRHSRHPSRRRRPISANLIKPTTGGYVQLGNHGGPPTTGGYVQLGNHGGRTSQRYGHTFQKNGEDEFNSRDGNSHTGSPLLLTSPSTAISVARVDRTSKLVSVRGGSRRNRNVKKVKLNNKFQLVSVQDNISLWSENESSELYDDETRNTRSANGTHQFYRVFSQSFLLFSASASCVLIVNPEGTVTTAPKDPNGKYLSCSFRYTHLSNYMYNLSSVTTFYTAYCSARGVA